MMNDVLEYKGYHTKITFNAESKTLRGIIEGITDFVDFETNDTSEVENEFHAAVDDYLDFCEEVGKAPEKEYKGSFNIRIRPELHKKIAIKALKANESINRTVERAIEEYVADDKHTYHEVTVTVQTVDNAYDNTSKSSFGVENTMWPYPQGQFRVMQGGAC